MKKISILFFAIVFTVSLKSQVVVDGVDINNEDIEYCQLQGVSKLLSNKVTVIIDYGQERKLMGRVQKVVGTDGKPVIFNSMVDALNFMSANGWEFVNAYAVTISNQNVYHYLMRKKQ